jgi:hypothetical protein
VTFARQGGGKVHPDQRESGRMAGIGYEYGFGGWPVIAKY